MATITLEIHNCGQCPFCKSERHLAADSWKNLEIWKCGKMDDKKIASGIEIHEAKGVAIPDWCPCQPVPDNTEEKLKEVIENQYDI